MFDWTGLSNFEIGLTIMVIAFWVLGLGLYGKMSYLVRLKEIELRKKGLIDTD